MKRIGITGQNGFVGSHLYNTLGCSLKNLKELILKKNFSVTLKD
jgi:UDP-2-acetamido-2,6-beta-L-arabino-hexul-4-ose reductase